MSSAAQYVGLTRLGHSCVLVVVRQADGSERRLLLDPGNLTPSLVEVGPVDAVLVTHAHTDHVDAAQLQAVRGATSVPVHGDEGVRALLAEGGIFDTSVLAPGMTSIAGVDVEVVASTHQPIYPEVPVPGNLSYLIAGTVLAPGDSFHVPDRTPDVLLLPLGAPWMKLADTIDYLRAVQPRIAVLVHDQGLAAAHQNLHRGLITKFAPVATTVVAPALGDLFDLTVPGATA